MRFYGPKEKMKAIKKKQNIIKVALSALHQTRIKDNRPLGKLLGDAVMSSVHTLLMIGGFIILFSVINRLLFHLQITAFFANGIELILKIFQIPTELSIPFISGLFEITMGSQLISQIKDVNLGEQAIITSLILGFSGLSVQAQVASILAPTDIDFKPFFWARIMHGVFAAAYTFLLWKPIYERFYGNEQSSHTIPASILYEDTTVYKLSFNLLILVPSLRSVYFPFMLSFMPKEWYFQITGKTSSICSSL